MLCLQVRIDNENPNHTVLIIDSANRPGTLVEVSQSPQCRAGADAGARQGVQVGGTAWPRAANVYLWGGASTAVAPCACAGGAVPDRAGPCCCEGAHLVRWRLVC